jgi:ketosteroid isomerase-like protein
MHKFLSVLLVAGSLGVLVGCQAKKEDIVNLPYLQEQKQIEQAVHDIFDAAKRKDFDQLEAFHLIGPKFTKFDDWEPMSRQDALTAMKSERDRFSQLTDFRMDIKDLKADVFGDIAIATFVATYTGKMGDTPIAAMDRCTLVFVRVGKLWKITHEHFSSFKPSA